MIITTERLILEPISLKYLTSTHRFSSDPENTCFMLFLPFESIEETQEFITEAAEEMQKPEPTFYRFAVIHDGIHIGTVNLYLNEERTTAEFGWIIDKRFHGQGFASEAASALLDHAVRELGIRHFIAHCDTENIPSRRVMEKLGMKLISEHGGRKNRLSDEESREYEFGLTL